MSYISKKIFPALLIIFAFANVALADDNQIKLQMVVEKETTVTDANGEKKTVLVEPKLVIPGDEVIYTIVYTNVGDKDATDVVITNPVAEHTVYTADSAAGDGTEISFSVDGGKHFASPDELTVTTPDGEERPASAADYNAIRWVVTTPVSPNSEGTVTYRARVK